VEEKRKADVVLVGKPEGKILLGRPRLRETGRVVWTRLIWFRQVGCYEYGNFIASKKFVKKLVRT
jgi:hypothetical protein